MTFMSKMGFKNVPKAVQGIFWVILTVNIGNYMVPFMSLFLSSKLEMSSVNIGIYVSLSGLVFLPGSLVGGKLADVWGKKQVFTFFQLLAVVVTLTNIFVLDKFWTPILFILNSLFVAATIPVYNSTIFDMTSETNMKDSLSLFFVGLNIGNIFSGLIGAAFFSQHYRMLFLVELILKLLSILLFLWLVHYDGARTQHVEDSGLTKEDEVKGGLFYVIFKSPILLLFSVSCMLFSIVLSQNNYSLPLHLNHIFGESGTTYYGIVLGINAFVVVMFTGLINRITRQKKKLDLILLACGLLGTGFGIIFFSNHFLILILSTVLWSLADILNTPNSSAYFSEFAPSSMLGRFSAWIKIVTGAGYAIGPILMGIIINMKGTVAVWPILFIIAMLSACILNIVRMLDKKRCCGLQNKEGDHESA